MKKIIDKKIYNTETATYIGGYEYGNSGDFARREKSLYKTKKGQYFRYDSGGALTDMAVSCGSNSTTGSQDIQLLTREEAFAFLQKYDTAACEKEFPEMIQEG